MPKKLQKSLQDYLTKIKKPTPPTLFRSHSLSYSKDWILSGCRQPKTHSFSAGHGKDEAWKTNVGDSKGGEATLSDVDRFLFENFKSLYVKDDEVDFNEQKGKESSGEVPFGSPRFMQTPRNLCRSQRFFVTAAPSSSLIEEARTSVMTMSEDAGSSSSSTRTTASTMTTTDEQARDVALPDHCVAVLSYSSIPYKEFRRSMQEMVEARRRTHGEVDWNFMEELLFCYLSLNEKKSHRYILSAFADLIVLLRRSPEGVPARSRSVQPVRIAERERWMKRRET